MGSFLLAAGKKSKRYALPNSELIVHQPSSSVNGQATDIKIHADWILKTKNKINKIYSDLTGQSVEKIKNDLECDFFMSAEEAK